MADFVTDHREWLIEIGCKGIVCGGCHEVIVEKRTGQPIFTSVNLIDKCVERHLETCRQVLEYNGSAAATALDAAGLPVPSENPTGPLVDHH